MEWEFGGPSWQNWWAKQLFSDEPEQDLEPKDTLLCAKFIMVTTLMLLQNIMGESQLHHKVLWISEGLAIWVLEMHPQIKTT